MSSYPADRSFAQAACDATIKAGSRPVDMVYFAAREGKPADYCRRRVRDCDVYIGVIGFRYGSRVPGDGTDLSYTELEFNEAARAGKPRLMFLLDENAPVPRALVDVDGRRVEQFRARVRSSGVVSAFSTADGLEAAVLHALTELAADLPVGNGTAWPPGVGGGLRRPWMVPAVGLVVERSELADVLVGRLLATGGDAVEVTTGVEGAGGFGKTTLAAVACSRDEVRRRYPGGLVWVTVGEHAAGAELADLVNGACEALTGVRPSSSDPLVAGGRLGEVLDGRPDTLLVLDDVWTAGQLAPFLVGGLHCRRLVTTRNRGLLPRGAGSVVVDAMTRQQAAATLQLGLGGLAATSLTRLLALTGRWPVLLGLVNAALHDRVADGADPDQAARWVTDRLAVDGPTALDVTDEQTRHRAVAATLAVSLDRLPPAEQELYGLLAVFPEDTDIPSDVLALLWQTTGHLPAIGAETVRERFVRLRLVTGCWVADRPAVCLHDVIRDYLRRRLSPADLAAAHRRLVSAARTLLPAQPAAAPAPWWALPPTAGYFWRHLPWHLREAGEHAELACLLEDLRWTTAKIQILRSVVPVEADLALADTPAVQALRQAVAQNGHLLTPLEPGGGLGPTLASRLDTIGALAPAVAAFLGTLNRPYLRSRWRLHDLPAPSTRRILGGHNAWVNACAVSPDGRLLASADQSGAVRVYRTDTWELAAVLDGHDGPVRDCTFTPDGSALVSAGNDGTARVWDPHTGRQRGLLLRHDGALTCCTATPDGSSVVVAGLDGTAVLTDLASCTVRAVLAGHDGGATACAVSPDGRTIATAGNDRAVRIWDAASGTQLNTRVLTAGVTDCAFSPDGRLLATTADDGTCELWELPALRTQALLTGHTASARACAFSPDGRLVATAGYDQAIRVWDTMKGGLLATLTGHPGWARDCTFTPDGTCVVSAGAEQVRIWALTGAHDPAAATGGQHRGWVRGCAVSPDGAYLATGGDDHIVRLWAATGEVVTAFQAHTGYIHGCAFSPGGELLATAGDDAVVRLWTVPAGEPGPELRSHRDTVLCCAFSPDGRLIASGGWDHTARLWDTRTGEPRLVLRGHSAAVNACAFAPGGTILATASADGTTRLWDPVTGSPQALLAGHEEWVNACAFTRDGTYLVTGSGDHTVRIWDVRTGHHVRTLTGHTHWVRGCAVSPDDRWVATTSRDKTIRVWEFDTGRCVAALRAEARLTTCTWTTTSSIAIAGDAGVYHLTLVTESA